MSRFPASTWLVGAGNMGGAMLRRWIASGVDPASVTVLDPQLPAVPPGVRVVGDAREAGNVPEAIVLAVKPQQVREVGRALLVPMPGQPALLISILAGVDLATLSDIFGADATVRAMPNLPASIGQGVVALHGTSASPDLLDLAEALMKPLGLVEWLDDERLFHAVTALSGSGPGFVFRFVDALAAAGEAQGLPYEQSLRFAIATVEGAAALARGSDELPAILAERVASPGGTTRAGLDVLDRDDALKALVAATIDAAARRSAELAEAARG